MFLIPRLAGLVPIPCNALILPEGVGLDVLAELPQAVVFAPEGVNLLMEVDELPPGKVEVNGCPPLRGHPDTQDIVFLLFFKK